MGDDIFKSKIEEKKEYLRRWHQEGRENLYEKVGKSLDMEQKR